MTDVSDEVRHVRMAQTEDFLMRKLDKIFHEAEDDGRCLTSEELDDIHHIWETMHEMHAAASLAAR